MAVGAPILPLASATARRGPARPCARGPLRPPLRANSFPGGAHLACGRSARKDLNSRLAIPNQSYGGNRPPFLNYVCYAMEGCAEARDFNSVLSSSLSFFRAESPEELQQDQECWQSDALGKTMQRTNNANQCKSKSLPLLLRRTGRR